MLDSEIARVDQTSLKLEPTTEIGKQEISKEPIQTPDVKPSKLKQAISTGKVVQPKETKIETPVEIPQTFTVPPERQ